jgi:hypothetical protein
MSAVKYLLASCPGDAGIAVPLALPALLAAIGDADDDIRAAAADACVPVAATIAAQGAGVVAQLAALLWGMLPTLSELSAAVTCASSRYFTRRGAAVPTLRVWLQG